MKRILLFICLAVISIAAKAQTSLLATLCHDGEITTYYSSKALQRAHAAAQDGDVITLSGGMFEAINVTKNVTIRGAGMAGADPTVISGDMRVKPASTDGNVTLEGLFINERLTAEQAHGLHLVKCGINTFITSTASGSYASNNINIIHCDIFGSYGNGGSGTVITNSYINGNPSNATCENSIIRYLNRPGSSNLKNCILIYTGSSQSDYLPATNVCQGCYYIGATAQPFRHITNNTNKAFPADTKYLKEGTTTYELLDELQTTWLGTDGTQVGMHGGSLPFDPETTTPKIKKFEVSSKTSADGKLSINLEIDAD